MCQVHAWACASGDSHFNDWKMKGHDRLLYTAPLRQPKEPSYMAMGLNLRHAHMNQKANAPTDTGEYVF
jgi:hypothetical protein